MKTLLTAILLIASLPLLAQPAESATPRVFRSEVELQAFRFGNFFQARGGQPQEDVTAFGAEYRAAYRPRPEAADYYASVNVLNYSAADTQTSYGAQVGTSHYGSVHSYNAYINRQENGYAFDVGDQTATANITALGGQYAYRIAHDWQVGADAYLERQRFDVQTGFENDYRNAGVQVRYRRFRAVQPRLGYVVGKRDVRNELESYNEHYWYAQLNVIPHPRVNATIRYRARARDYENIDRTDHRAQWTLRATVKQNARFAWTAAYGSEGVDSSTPGRDFDTNVAFAGLIIAF
ncbi:MAG: outer membrane beta-barrel protein [Acidobacteriota bacterium]